jgi:hypothetical protein
MQLQAAIPEGVSSGDIRYSRGADTEYSHVTSAAVTNSSTALTVPVPAAAVSSTSLVAVTAPDIYSNSTGSGAYSGTADDSVPPLVHGGADSDVSPNDSTSSLTSSALATAAHACMAAAAAPTNSSSGIGTRVLRTMRIMIPQAEVCVSNDGSSFAVYQVTSKLKQHSTSQCTGILSVLESVARVHSTRVKRRCNCL